MLLDVAITGNVQKFKEALENQENVNTKDENGQSVLSIVSKLRPDLVKILIRNGVDVNLADDNLITPLHWAVEYDNDEIVELLLQNGANPGVLDSLGERPLHWAAWTGHIRSAKVLLKYDREVLFENCGGFTPIDLAVQQEHHDLAELLQTYITKK